MSRFLKDSYLNLIGIWHTKFLLVTVYDNTTRKREKQISFSGSLCSDILCCAKSDMIADGNRDIETCGFSDILFADKLPQAI
ncbi:MAG: hypothetical protein PUC29_03245 [Clostridia bacterium]|nr:hypothetical protein [Clostridia bacterium]